LTFSPKQTRKNHVNVKFSNLILHLKLLYKHYLLIGVPKPGVLGVLGVWGVLGVMDLGVLGVMDFGVLGVLGVPVTELWNVSRSKLSISIESPLPRRSPEIITVRQF
jgi:hypothetical protein